MGPGWEIISPFDITDGAWWFWSTAGFLPELTGRATTSPAPPTTPLSLSGFARQVRRAGPPLRRATIRERNRWFWWDLRSDGGSGGRAGAAAAAPVFVQLAGGAAEGSGAATAGADPVIAIPNNHLSYALTWFGLALALAVITVLRLRS